MNANRCTAAVKHYTHFHPTQGEEPLEQYLGHVTQCFTRAGEDLVNKKNNCVFLVVFAEQLVMVWGLLQLFKGLVPLGLLMVTIVWISKNFLCYCEKLLNVIHQRVVVCKEKEEVLGHAQKGLQYQAGPRGRQLVPAGARGLSSFTLENTRTLSVRGPGLPSLLAFQ